MDAEGRMIGMRMGNDLLQNGAVSRVCNSDGLVRSFLVGFQRSIGPEKRRVQKGETRETRRWLPKSRSFQEVLIEIEKARRI